MTSETDDLDMFGFPKKDVNALLTQDNVSDWLDMCGQERMNGYEIATADLTVKISKIVELTNSFDELKTELTQLLQGRKDFLNYLNKSFDRDEGEYVFD